MLIRSAFAALLCFYQIPDTVHADDEAEFEVSDAGELDSAAGDVLRRRSPNHARVERLLSVPIPRTLRSGYLQYVIEHHASIPVDDEPFHNFLGFDAGEVKIGFGLSYGVSEWMDVSLLRNNGVVERFDSYQFTARAALSDETADDLMDFAVIFGGTWFTISGESDVWGNLMAVLAGKSLFDRLYVSSGLLYHESSTARDKTSDDEDLSIAVMGGAICRLTDSMVLVAEYSIPFEGYEAENLAWATGLKFITHGHTFAIMGGNTQYVGLDGLAAGTSLEESDVVLGFSITREFAL